MNRENLGRMGACASLLALLAVCGYAGAKAPQTTAVSVPVFVSTAPEEAFGLRTMEETKAQLKLERERAIALWQSVLDDPAAGEGDKRRALEKQTELAERMAQEAALTALLSYMGVGEAAAVLSQGGVSVIVPWQAGEDERSRVRILDAAMTQTGLDASQVKIILAKNEG